AHYLEGHFLPYRMVMTGLTAGTHTLVIQWDTTKGGKHALDYLGTYNASVGLAANPCAGVTGCAAPSTMTIPKDPNITKFTQMPGVMTAFGGTITGFSTYTLSGDYAGDSSTSIGINFTTTASQSTVVMAWGGHISNHLNWVPALSAITITGSPYH